MFKPVYFGKTQKVSDGFYSEKGNFMKRIRVVLISAAVVLIAAGVFNGGLYDTLSKGIRICMECIGIG